MDFMYTCTASMLLETYQYNIVSQHWQDMGQWPLSGVNSVFVLAAQKQAGFVSVVCGLSGLLSVTRYRGCAVLLCGSSSWRD